MGGHHSKDAFRYTVEVGDEKPGETKIFRCSTYPQGLIHCPKRGDRTVQEIIKHNWHNWANRPYLGTVQDKPQGGKEYVFKTHGQVKQLVMPLGSAMLNLGLAPAKHLYRTYNLRSIGIHSKNSEEWILIDLAVLAYGMTTVPIYDTLGEEAVQHMLQETQIETLFLSTEMLDHTLKRFKDGKSFYLKNLVIMDQNKLTPEQLSQLNDPSAGFKWYKLYDLIEQGKANILDLPTVTPDDVAFFSYTSGTTGRPKGAMVTHRNCVAAIGGAEHRLYFVTGDSVYLSYLPLAHVMEKDIQMYLYYKGGKIGLYSGDMTKIKEDLALLRPTFFASVPRMLNKFYDALYDRMSKTTGFKGYVAKRAMSKKLSAIKHDPSVYKDGVYDSLVFNKAKEVLGGRCEFILSSSAPMSMPAKNFLKIAFCCPILEGYGQTEGLGGQFCMDIHDPDMDSVGGPCAMNEFKLVDVPDMGYTSKDVDEQGQPAPRGEIWIRGPNIIPGYFLNDEKNLETFTPDGWLKSGDIGTIKYYNGSLKIIDRKKNIFKLSHGEYVAPEKLEQFYKSCHGIADIYVHGDSLKSVLVAVTNVDEALAPKIASELNIPFENLSSFCKDPKTKEYFLAKLRDCAKENGLKGFERIADLYIDPVPFAQKDLITTTFKLKRPEAQKTFKAEIEQLYIGKD
jgi:long-chain acyl-CoA synthetase